DEGVATTQPGTIDAPRSPRPADAFVPMVVMIAVMWAVEVVDVPLDGRLDRFGIRPRQLDGLDGVVLAPFLHLGWAHLIANTVPFVVMGGVICLSGAKRFVQVTVIVGLVSGLGVWLTGAADSLVIGASGLVFGYLTYLVARGVFARNLLYLAVGAAVLAVYGGVIWGVLPRPGISWQGHLFGAIGGVVAAAVLHGTADDQAETASSSGSTSMTLRPPR
ncbi:MAG TPA: rhomboid family intramembrane serine protease, partial [Ilumatobacteraceae bacterium]|nr:rhomboid family intramembrane serine protease [Ilumatobacteraceae bacterium]